MIELLSGIMHFSKRKKLSQENWRMSMKMINVPRGEEECHL